MKLKKFAVLTVVLVAFMVFLYPYVEAYKRHFEISSAVINAGNAPHIRELHHFDAWEYEVSQSTPILVVAKDKIFVWNLNEGKRIAVLKHSVPRHHGGLYDLFITNIAISPDGNFLASGTSGVACEACGGDLRLWHLPDGELMRVIDNDGVENITFSPDSSLLAYVAYDEAGIYASVFDIDAGEELARFPDTRCIAFDPTGDFVVFYQDTNLQVWNLSAEQTPISLDTIVWPVLKLVFSPDGNLLAASGDSEDIIIWDTNTWAIDGVLEGPSGSVKEMVFSPDGTLLASINRGNDTIRLWDMEIFSLSYGFASHDGDVETLAFHPTENMLASGGRDGFIRFWDTLTGQEILSLQTVGYVDSLAFGLDGRILISTDEQGMRLWGIQ